MHLGFHRFAHTLSKCCKFVDVVHPVVFLGIACNIVIVRNSLHLDFVFIFGVKLKKDINHRLLCSKALWGGDENLFCTVPLGRD